MATTSLSGEEERERIRALLLAAGFRELAQGARTFHCRSAFVDGCGEQGFDLCARLDQGIVEVEHASSCWCQQESPSHALYEIWNRWLEMYFHLLQAHGYRSLIAHLPNGRPVLRVLIGQRVSSSRMLQEIEALIPQDFR